MTTQARACSVARTLDLVGAKWALLAVREMLLGSHRFDEIVRNTGAPRDVLADRLRRLESHGLVERVRYEERPPRFEYRLTDEGRDLAPVVAALREFGDRHLAGAGGPPLRLTHSCGADYRPVLSCRACGEVPRDGEIAVATAPAQDRG